MPPSASSSIAATAKSSGGSFAQSQSAHRAAVERSAYRMRIRRRKHLSASRREARHGLPRTRRNRSPQIGYVFQQLQHQTLEIGVRKAIEVCGRRHAGKESDSPRLGNLIIIPMPGLLPLLLEMYQSIVVTQIPA
jgi:hypothetical protein